MFDFDGTPVPAAAQLEMMAVVANFTAFVGEKVYELTEKDIDQSVQTTIEQFHESEVCIKPSSVYPSARLQDLPGLSCSTFR